MKLYNLIFVNSASKFWMITIKTFNTRLLHNLRLTHFILITNQ